MSRRRNDHGYVMSYYGVTATNEGLRSARTGRPVATVLARHLERLPKSAKVTILIHGYQYHPDTKSDDPHRLLFAFKPAVSCWKIRSWSHGLGFTRRADENGLCIGFAWPAAAGVAKSYLTTGKSPFHGIYQKAPEFGRQLAELVAMVQAADPGRRIDLVAHSLGARVALSSLPHLEKHPERIILLGGAEFDSQARRFLEGKPKNRTAHIYSFTARSNDIYDAAFEMFAPRTSSTDMPIGSGGKVDHPNWINIQIDRAEVSNWINAQDIPLRPVHRHFCHWSFYTRHGAFGIYRAILDRKPGWDIEDLRRVPGLTEQEPRWSRVLSAFQPRIPRRFRGTASGHLPEIA